MFYNIYDKGKMFCEIIDKSEVIFEDEKMFILLFLDCNLDIGYKCFFISFM